jgi:hypothetical protein
MIKIIQKKNNKPKPSLKMNIHKRLPEYDNGRSHKVLHASDMTKDEEFCAREYALMDVVKAKKKGQFLGTSMKMTFDLGDAIHDLVREKWALGESIGSWYCFKCGSVHPFQKRPSKCGYQGCPGKHFKYREEMFMSQDHGATGSIDMLADFGEPLLRIVEIKSIDKDQFKELVGPKAEHKWRTSLYLRLIENSSHPNKKRINLQEGLVFYVVKGYGVKDETLKAEGLKDTAFTPFKEYWVQRDDNSTNGIWQRAIDLYDFRKNGAGMPQGICTQAFCKRAQSCSMHVPCWSGKYPAGAK